MFCSNLLIPTRRTRRAGLRAPRGGWPIHDGVGSNWSPCSTRPEPSSVHRVRTGCGGRLFTAKLTVVVHDLAHQLLNHLLADDAILLACHFCECLSDSVDDFICFSGIDFA